jgi:outer membrane protein assembly factor BamB
VISADGTIYVFSRDTLYAFDYGGSLKWSYKTDGVAGEQATYFCTPAIDSSGTIYFGDNAGVIYAIASDGTLNWSAYHSEAGYYTSPAIGADGTIYIASDPAQRDNGDRAKLFSYQSNGTFNWSFPIGADFLASSPVVVGDTIYIGGLYNKLVAIKVVGLPGATLKWSYTTGGLVLASPAIGPDGTIYLGSDDNKLWAFVDKGTYADTLWTYATGDDVRSTPAIDSDGNIYFGSDDDKLYAIDTTGTLRWTYTTSGDVYSSPAIDGDGNIYFGSRSDSLYSLKSDGTLNWAYCTDGDVDASPSIGPSGTIYFGSNDNKIYAIGPGEGLPPVPAHGMQLKGCVYSPFDFSCEDMIAILGDTLDNDYDSMRVWIRRDLDSLANHGYNIIRAYHHPEVDTNASPCSLLTPTSNIFRAFDTLLTMLDEEDFKLYVTLTDASDWDWSDMCRRTAVSDTAQFRDWLDTLLTGGGRGYANDATIACWDIVSDVSIEEDTCNDWCRHILPYLQGTLDTSTAVTRGISSGESDLQAVGDTLRAIGDFDIFDWHPYLYGTVGGKERWYWTPLPDSVESFRTGSWEHMLSFGDFGFPIDTIPEMQQRQMYRDYLFKMSEMGITKAILYSMYDDTLGGQYWGVYRSDGRFKPAGELISQVFQGVDWQDIPIIGNWHMELDDSDNYQDEWGKPQPTCWRTQQWSGDPGDVTFSWDSTQNHTPDTLPNYTEKHSLKIATASECDPCTLACYFNCYEGTAVAPSVSYACTAWVRRLGTGLSSGSDSVWVGIRWYDKSGTKISESEGDKVSGVSSNWSALTVSDTSPGSAYSCLISCLLKASDACTVWFDDAQLYEDQSWKTYSPWKIEIEKGEDPVGGITQLEEDDGSYFKLESELESSEMKIDWYGQRNIEEDRNDVTGLAAAYDGHYSQEDTVRQYICLWDWTSEPQKYDTLCATSSSDSCWNDIRQADITQRWSTIDPTEARKYISTDGYKTIRMKVIIEPEASTDTTTCWADYMKFSVRYDPD